MMGSSFMQLLTASFLLFTFLNGSVHAIKKPYIVYLGGHSHGPDPSPGDLESATNSHYDFLSSVLGSHEKAMEAIFYSYNKYINGFAAKLEEEEAAEIAKNPKVVSVFLDKAHKLHTTRSWEFLELDKQGILPAGSAWKRAGYGENTTIANIDTGVWPESESFSDEGIGPVPSKWRGICQLDKFRCNRKLIGARIFYKGYEEGTGNKLHKSHYTARDYDGHGSHTLSTAGGNFVPNASVRGLGNGTAKGGSPRAHVVAYKACWYELKDGTCYHSDMLEAFEFAIRDGVDVISISLGSSLPIPRAEQLFTDGISIGAFHAISKNIVVVASAGNDGNKDGSVANVAPWVFTVAASSIDRAITSNVALGGKKRILKGASLNRGPTDKYYPPIKGVDAKLRNARTEDAEYCRPGTLDPSKVKGKALICARANTITSLREAAEGFRAGAKEVLFVNDDSSGNTLLSEAHPLNTAQITEDNTVNPKPEDRTSTKKSNGIPNIFMSGAKTYVGIKPAPQMAAFSSRGPNAIQPLILKPDITAPGLSIIAAYSLAASPIITRPGQSEQFNYNTLSGTSQACPHVAGIVGLLKTLHPKWSPAAIKSAIMTTATTLDNTNRKILDAHGKNATPFNYGAGHVQPNFAVDPGLVYDLGPKDYLNYLCVSNYDQNVIMLFNNQEPYTCPKSYDLANFNYPSITVRHSRANPVIVTRTVTNVGPPGTYVAKTEGEEGLQISVNLKSLTFKRIYEKKTFQVIVNVTRPATHPLFGELLWTNGKHKVRSPVVVL